MITPRLFFFFIYQQPIILARLQAELFYLVKVKDTFAASLVSQPTSRYIYWFFFLFSWLLHLSIYWTSSPERFKQETNDKIRLKYWHSLCFKLGATCRGRCIYHDYKGNLITLISHWYCAVQLKLHLSLGERHKIVLINILTNSKNTSTKLYISLDAISDAIYGHLWRHRITQFPSIEKYKRVQMK